MLPVRILIFVTFLMMIPHLVSAGDAPRFVPAKLPYGISVDIPNSWISLSGALKDTQFDTAQALIDLTGLEHDINTQPFLINIVQPNKATYAGIYLSVGLNQETKKLTQDEVHNLGQEEIKSLNNETFALFQKMFAPVRMKILAWRPVKIINQNNLNLISYEYFRTSPVSSDEVIVYMYQFQNGDKPSVNLSCEYKFKDEFLWEPICQRVMKSLKVSF